MTTAATVLDNLRECRCDKCGEPWQYASVGSHFADIVGGTGYSVTLSHDATSECQSGTILYTGLLVSLVDLYSAVDCFNGDPSGAVWYQDWGDD